MNTPRHKSDLLTNIETLWQDAAHSADAPMQSTFQRLSVLMQDAMATETSVAEIVANDIPPGAKTDPAINALAALVEDTAAHSAATGSAGTTPSVPSFDDTKARMDSVARLKPPHHDSFNSGAPEYVFGTAFTDLIRHVVRDYIHNEVETVIKGTLTSELDSYFKSKKGGSGGKNAIRPQPDENTTT